MVGCVCYCLDLLPVPTVTIRILLLSDANSFCLTASLQPWPANEAVWKYGDRCRREGLRVSQGVINLAMEESLSDVRTCSFDFQIEKSKWDSTIDSAGALALDVASLAGIPTGL
eukprot:57668-Rhodomonas_salina.1